MRTKASKEKEKARQRQQYQERLAQGLCPRCGGTPATEKKFCASCSTRTCGRDKQRRLDRLAKGLCPQCGKRECAPGRKKCVVCGEAGRRNVKARESRLVNDGLCTRCGQHPFLQSMTDRTSRYRECQECYLKRTAKNNLGSEDFAPLLLAKLEAQQWMCPYTDEILVLGHNDSIDHILPRSRFPDLATDPENVQWVLRDVNSMKNQLTNDEFLGLVAIIYRHRLR